MSRKELQLHMRLPDDARARPDALIGMLNGSKRGRINRLNAVCRGRDARAPGNAVRAWSNGGDDWPAMVT